MKNLKTKENNIDIFDIKTIDINKFTSKKKSFNCYFICNRKHKEEQFKQLITKLIELGCKELNFTGRYKEECELYSDLACVDIDHSGTKPEDWCVPTCSWNIRDFAFWVTTCGLDFNHNSLLLYDDEKALKRVIELVKKEDRIAWK